jgi:predicted lipoprotein with Yx(FWY)xxD motif
VTRALPAIAILALATALIAAGCGGDDSSSSSGAYGSRGETGSTQAAKSGSKPAATGESDRGGTVAVAKNPELGAILVDSRGFTIYDFHKDEGGKSACYGSCADLWPPLLTSGEPRATQGAMAAKLGTAERSDGTVQVTYAGHPLYTYVVDAKPGEAKGNDIDSFGAEWYALQPNGQEPDD